MTKLFIKKPIEKILEQADGDHNYLKRSLSTFSLVMFGIGALIGAGLFLRTTVAAADNAGPSVTIAYILAAMGSAFSGLCYAEFASKIPIAGSAYTYSYATMGEFIAWIIGWDLVLEYSLGAATVAVSWGHYFNKLLGYIYINGMPLTLPYALCHSPFHNVPDASGVMQYGFMNLPAFLVVIFLTILVIRGTSG
jgi:basic amino acid/polyamine antiporter, APA family